MPFHIDPPLLNSANPWATTIDDIRNLYDSPYTGAVTTRTCTLNGFAHDNDIHQYIFFNPQTLNSSPDPAASAKNTGSLNTLGYSPIPLSKLVELLKGFADELSNRVTGPGTSEKVSRKGKPIIISITGLPEEVRRCYRVIKPVYQSLISSFPIYIEINLSCPNISGTSSQPLTPPKQL
jgi:dihydroorotate dehydrogenase (fumarate)